MGAERGRVAGGNRELTQVTVALREVLELLYGRKRAHSQATHAVLWSGLHLSRSTMNGLPEG